MLVGECLGGRVDTARLGAGNDGRRAVLGGEFMKADQRLAVHMETGIDTGRKFVRIVKVPIGVVDMRLLPWRAGKKTVCGERPKDELATQNRTENLHHQRVLNHVDKYLTLVQKVPDPALKMDLVGVLTMKMGGRLRLVGMRIDDPVRLGHLLGRENAFRQIVSRPVQQSLDSLLGTLVPVHRHFVHDSIHSCAGSL